MAVDAGLSRQFTVEICDLTAHKLGGQDGLDRARAAYPFVDVLDPRTAPNMQH